MTLKTKIKLNKKSLDRLNQEFKPLSPIERIEALYRYFDMEEVLMTSSFGTKSALLLYWVSNIQPQQPVHFLDTGYHFEETLTYKRYVARTFGLNVIDIKPNERLHQKTKADKLWSANPNQCCYVNKVLPLEQVKLDHQIWVSGLMAYQTPNRQQLNIFEQKDKIVKFYPLIDITKAQFEQLYQAAYLPVHPLQPLGYESIGCLHCTARGQGRNGRWCGNGKTECGLHN